MIRLKFMGGPADGYECVLASKDVTPGQIIEINRSKRLYATAIPLKEPLPTEILLHDVGPARTRNYRETG
jgi:hypothetical protein